MRTTLPIWALLSALLSTVTLACDDAGLDGMIDVNPGENPRDVEPRDVAPDAEPQRTLHFEKILGQEDGLAAPDGLFLRPDGRVLVANEQGRNVLLVDVDARTVEVVAAGGGLRAPEEVALGPDGSLYVSDDSAHSVFKITDGVPEAILGEADGLQSPEGIAVGADGSVFVADERARILLRRYPDGRVETIGTAEDGIFAPEGLAMAPSGDLYIADDQRGGVLVVRPGGDIEVFVDAATLVRPEAVAVGPSGDLWFTDNGGSATLQRFTQAGERLSSWDVPVATNHLAGIAVLQDGRIVLSAFHNSGVHAIWLATEVIE